MGSKLLEFSSFVNSAKELDAYTCPTECVTCTLTIKGKWLTPWSKGPSWEADNSFLSQEIPRFCFEPSGSLPWSQKPSTFLYFGPNHVHWFLSYLLRAHFNRTPPYRPRFRSGHFPSVFHTTTLCELLYSSPCTCHKPWSFRPV